jgi:hypothetical protein
MSLWRRFVDHTRDAEIRAARQGYEDLSPLETTLDEVLPGVGGARHRPTLEDEEQCLRL